MGIRLVSVEEFDLSWGLLGSEADQRVGQMMGMGSPFHQLTFLVLSVFAKFSSRGSFA